MKPETITKERLYKLLHISKRKAKWLLDEGIIPCVNRGTKTHTYLIRLEDVQIYLERSDAERRHEIPTGQFNAHPAKSRRKRENLPQPELWEGDGEAFAAYLEEQWALLPDDLSVAQVVRMTGMCEKKVLHHLQTGKLTAVRFGGRYHIPKTAVIAFCTGRTQGAEESGRT